MKVHPKEWQRLKLNYSKGTEGVKHYRRLRRKAAKAYQRAVRSGKNSEQSFDNFREAQKKREEARKEQRALHLFRMYYKGTPYRSVEPLGSKPVDFSQVYWFHHEGDFNKIVRWVYA